MNKWEQPDDKSTIIFLAGTTGLLLGLFFLRVILPLGLLLLLAGSVMIIYGLYLVISSELRKVRAKPDKNTFEGRISIRLAECRAKEAQFRNESDFIRSRIQALREDLERSSKADETERARAQVLIKDFEAEFDLRHAKVSFFSECAERLEELLARHRLHQSIADRKQELEKLRQSNFDDVASMEETRYHLEQDTIQLDTITELSKGAAVSFKKEQAEELRLRLEKLRSSLGRPPGEAAE